MLRQAYREELSKVLRPVSRRASSAMSTRNDQRERLLDLVHKKEPWKLIIARHFASAEKLLATLSGALPEGVTPTLADMSVSGKSRD
jgi:hypothetical protein